MFRLYYIYNSALFHSAVCRFSVALDSLTPNLVEQSVFDGTPVDTQLYTAGLHVALVVDGVGRILQNVAVLTANSQRTAAQVAGDLTVILYAAPPPTPAATVSAYLSS